MLKFCFWIPYPTFYYDNNNNNDNSSIDKHPNIFFHCCISTLSALFLFCPMPIPLQFFGNCCISNISTMSHSLKKEAQHPKSLKNDLTTKEPWRPPWLKSPVLLSLPNMWGRGLLHCFGLDTSGGGQRACLRIVGEWRCGTLTWWNCFHMVGDGPQPDSRGANTHYMDSYDLKVRWLSSI